MQPSLNDNAPSESQEGAVPLVAPRKGGGWTVPLLLVTLALAGGAAFAYTSWRSGQAAARESAAKSELKKLGVVLMSSSSGDHVGTANLSLIRTPENFERAMELLPDLAWLEVIDLSGKQVTAEQLTGLASLDRLDTLTLARTGLDDSSAAVLAQFPALGALHLSGNPLTAAALENLSGMTSLTVLDLSETDLAGDLAPLAGLTELKWLVLRGVELDDTAIQTLTSLPALKRLSLVAGQITDEQHTTLRQVSGLQIDGMDAGE